MASINEADKLTSFPPSRLFLYTYVLGTIWPTKIPRKDIVWDRISLDGSSQGRSFRESNFNYIIRVSINKGKSKDIKGRFDVKFRP